MLLYIYTLRQILSNKNKLWICDTNQCWPIFIYMTKKTKHLRIRITESQFKKIADALITEERNKSQLVRNALNHYLNINKTIIDAGNSEDKKTDL